MPEVASKKQQQTQPKEQKEEDLPLFFTNKAEIDAEAKKDKEARALPVAPAERVNFEAFTKWLKLLTPEMVEDNRLMLYVYRLDPVIDRQRVDPTSDNNIDVISGTVDNLHKLNEDYFINRHGGGKYKIVVNDQEKKGSFGRIVLESYLTIPVVQHPPKLDLREVIWDHKFNKGYKSWARANKLIDENDMPITAPVTQQVNGSGNTDQLVSAMKLIMDFTKQMSAEQERAIRKQTGTENETSKGIHDIILERLKQDDPNKQVSTVSQLVGALKTLMPESKTSDLAVIMPLIVQMMQHQSDQSNKQFQLVLELLKSNKGEDGEGGEKRDEVSRLRDLIEIARELKGGNPPGKNVVAETIESITPVISPALQIIANVVALRAQQQGVPVMPPTNPAPPKQATVNRQDTIKTNPNPPNPVTPQPLAPPAPPTETPIVSTDEATNLINQFKPIIMHKMAREGWEFAAWVAEGFGDQVAAGLARYGIEGLLTACRNVPDFWQQVNATYGEEYLREWLTSLVNYKAIMKKMEMEEGEEEKDELEGEI